jgi:hypothetical protein
MSPLIKDGDDLTLFPLNDISPGLGDVAVLFIKGQG